MALAAFFRTCSPVARCARRWSTLASERELRLDRLDGEYQGVALLVMNRPAKKNALGRLFISQMEESLAQLKHDSSVRTVILKSDVPGTFCSGADLKERAEMKEEEVGPFVSRLRRSVSDLADLPVPVIAAIDGTALGGGLEVALACDIRIAATTAKMGLVETKWAIFPGGGGTQRLPRVVGIGKAKQLIFTAKVLSGLDAANIGLVEEAVPQNSDSNAAYLKALEIAKEISSKGPIAVRLAKQAINNGMQVDLSTALRVEESYYALTIPTEDRIEGLKAFREKREPVYKGK